MATETKPQSDQETIPFYPDHVRTEAWVALGVLALVLVAGIIGQFFPVGLAAPADPMDTPAHIKPEWYFLFLYEFLKYVPKTVGVLVPVIGVLVLIIWPFIDRKREDSLRARRLRIVGVVVFLVVATVLTLMGELS